MLFQYRVSHTDAGTSQTCRLPCGPTPIDLCNLRAKLSKVDEDEKDDRNDVATLSSFCDQFLEKVSLPKESQSALYRSQAGLIEYIPQSSMNCHPGIIIRDPTGHVKTKGLPKIAMRIRSSIEASNENRQKKSCAFCEDKDTYQLDVGNVS